MKYKYGTRVKFHTVPDGVTSQTETFVLDGCLFQCLPFGKEIDENGYFQAIAIRDLNEQVIDPLPFDELPIKESQSPKEKPDGSRVGSNKRGGE